MSWSCLISTVSTCCDLDQSFDFIVHRAALCYELVVSEVIGGAKSAVKDVSGLSVRIKPTMSFDLPVSDPSLMIKSQDLLSLPDAGRGQVPCFP